MNTQRMNRPPFGHKRQLLCAAVAGVLMLGGCSLTETNTAHRVSDHQPGGAMYFFESGLPKAISADKGSTLTLSEQHYRDGSHSLRWDFSSESQLTFNQPIGFKPFQPNGSDQSRHSFLVWIYSETPVNDYLTFQFGENDQVNTHFKMKLDFTGWRHAIVPFGEMEGSPSEQMNRLTMVAPKSVDRGHLFIDQVMLSIPVDPRWPTRDNQLPFVNLAADTAPNSHWLSLYRFDQLAKEAAAASEESTEAVIAERFNALLMDEIRPLTDNKLNAIRDRYYGYQIRRENGRVTGVPLDNSNRLKIFLDKGVNKGLLDEQASELLFNNADLKQYSELMMDIAAAWHGTDTSGADGAVVREELATMFINLADYFDDQGFAYGSSLGTVHHFGYSLRPLFKAHFLMRGVLDERNRVERTQQMLSWFAGAGRIFEPADQIDSFNIDVMNTQLQGILASILLISDSNEQARWLGQLSQWLSASLITSPGTAGGFKEDGSMFHHSQHYPAYGKGGLKGLTPVVYLLSGTDYAISPQAHALLRNATLMTAVYANQNTTLMSVTGRHPTGEQSMETDPFLYMALSGTSDGQHPIDREMAATWLRLTDSPAPVLVDKFNALGIVANQPAVGNWSMNYAGLALHRRDGWVAGARGFSRYLVSHETYANANRYGRYINYGILEILPDNPEHRAFSHDGWNWARWPGTTAVQLPVDKLNADLRNVDTFSGLEEMLLSTQTFNGAMSMNDNGLFATIVEGHPKYDASFRANKSVFFFENRIIALGSGISTTDGQYNTQTTLFQHAVRPESETTVNGKVLSKGSEQRLSTSNTLLMDPNGNAYFLPKGQSLHVERKVQESRHQKNSNLTRGEFATAVLDHGKAPDNGSYEYAILVNTTPEKADRFRADLSSTEQPYRVIRRDNQAHIVRDRASGMTGYALFGAGAIDTGIVASVDTPVLLMTEGDESKLSLTLVDPDLRLYQGRDESQYDEQGVQKEVSIYSRSWRKSASIPHTLTLELKGQWQPASLPDSVVIKGYRDGNTLLAITTRQASSVEFELKR